MLPARAAGFYFLLQQSNTCSLHKCNCMSVSHTYCLMSGIQFAKEKVIFYIRHSKLMPIEAIIGGEVVVTTTIQLPAVHFFFNDCSIIVSPARFLSSCQDAVASSTRIGFGVYSQVLLCSITFPLSCLLFGSTDRSSSNNPLQLKPRYFTWSPTMTFQD